MRFLSVVGLVVVFTLSAVATPGMTVIDRAMIDRYRFPSVMRAIETAAGMDVLRTYFKQNVVTARGILQEHYANKILMMVDGVPAWNAITGEPIADRIDINDVERIEITKGPASVAYGDNAYVAAINIVLRRAARGEVGLHLAAGTESSFRAGAQATWGARGLELFVAGNGLGDEGRERSVVDERGQTARFADYQRGNNLTLQLRSPRHNFLFNGVNGTESFLGNTPDLNAGLGQDHKSRGYLAAYNGSLPTAAADLRYFVAYDATRRNFPRTGDGLTRSNVSGRRLSSGLHALLRRDGPLKIDGGAEVERLWSDEYTNYDVRSGRVLEQNNMRDRMVDEWATFARLEWEQPRWSAAAGVRFTHHELFGGNTSAEVRVGHVLPKNGRITLMGGRSFRAPSIFELYFQTSSNTVFGNTALRPETNTTWQVVYEIETANVRGQATLYHAVYENKIFRTRRLPDDPVDRSLIYVNGDRFSADGLELEARSTFGTISTFVTYSYIDGDAGDALPGTTHHNFRYVPNHTASIGMSQTFGAWSAAGTATLRSEADGPREPVDARASFDFDFGCAQRFEGLHVRHSLVVSNAFDSDEEVPEYVRRNLNEIPSSIGRRVSYMVRISRSAEAKPR